MKSDHTYKNRLHTVIRKIVMKKGDKGGMDIYQRDALNNMMNGNDIQLNNIHIYQLCEIRRMLTYLSNVMIHKMIDNKCDISMVCKIMRYVYRYMSMYMMEGGIQYKEGTSIRDSRYMHRILRDIDMSVPMSEVHGRYKNMSVRYNISSRYMMDECVRIGLQMYIDICMYAVRMEDYFLYIRCTSMFGIYRRVTSRIDVWYMRIDMKMNMVQGLYYIDNGMYDDALRVYTDNMIIWSTCYMMYNNIYMIDDRRKMKMHKIHMMMYVSLMCMFDIYKHTCDVDMMMHTVHMMRFMCDSDRIDININLMTSVYEKYYIKMYKKIVDQRDEMINIIDAMYEYDRYVHDDISMYEDTGSIHDDNNSSCIVKKKVKDLYDINKYNISIDNSKSLDTTDVYDTHRDTSKIHNNTPSHVIRYNRSVSVDNSIPLSHHTSIYNSIHTHSPMSSVLKDITINSMRDRCIPYDVVYNSIDTTINDADHTDDYIHTYICKNRRYKHINNDRYNDMNDDTVYDKKKYDSIYNYNVHNSMNNSDKRKNSSNRYKNMRSIIVHNSKKLNISYGYEKEKSSKMRHTIHTMMNRKKMKDMRDDYSNNREYNHMDTYRSVRHTIKNNMIHIGRDIHLIDRSINLDERYKKRYRISRRPVNTSHDNTYMNDMINNSSLCKSIIYNTS